MEELYANFLDSGECECCGSQRCDQSFECVEHCQKWHEFLRQQRRETD